MSNVACNLYLTCHLFKFHVCKPEPLMGSQSLWDMNDRLTNQFGNVSILKHSKRTTCSHFADLNFFFFNVIFKFTDLSVVHK